MQSSFCAISAVMWFVQCGAGEPEWLLEPAPRPVTGGGPLLRPLVKKKMWFVQSPTFPVLKNNEFSTPVCLGTPCEFRLLALGTGSHLAPRQYRFTGK